MIVTLAFKKNAEGIGSSLIRWFTKSDYSHVEMIINEYWISANADGGVHILPLQPLHPDWDYIDVEVSDERLSHVMMFIEAQANCSYDYTGIVFSQLFKINGSDRGNKWFCSELCAQILKEFQLPKMKNIDTANMCPKDLYYLFS